jgi:hypothetical protein
MIYSEDFKQRVKVAYPTCEHLHALLDEGNLFLGRYLGEGSRDSLSVDLVLAATSLEELQGWARQLQEKKALYREWYNAYREHVITVVTA